MELTKIWASVKEIISWQDVDNLKSDALTKWCKQRRNIIRKLATASATVLTVTGDFKISKGDLFKSKSGIEFEATVNITSENGTAYVPVKCTLTGKRTNLPADSITEMSTTIQGVTSVTNEQACTGGYDEETDESLRERYYNDLRKPITSNNIYHYEKWATECTGVGRAKAKPLWNGDNTVKVIIINQDMEMTDDELVTRVQNYIDPNCSGRGEGQAMIGAYCTVESAVKLPLNISFALQTRAGEDFETVKQLVISNIKSYLKEIAFKEKFVSYAK